MRSGNRARPVLLAVLLTLAAAIGAAFAQIPEPVPPPPKDLTGAWELSSPERDRTCTVDLKSDPAPGGKKIELGKGCVDAFPMSKDIVSWSVDAKEALRLLDARGRAVFQFTEVETGMYEGERPGDGLFFLQNLASLGVAPRTAEQMFGDWAMVRGSGRPVCSLTLTNSATGQDSYVLSVKAGCDPLVTRFGPTTWRMDRGELLLVSPRGVWRFEEFDSTTWTRVPDTADPLQLVKQ